MAIGAFSLRLVFMARPSTTFSQTYLRSIFLMLLLFVIIAGGGNVVVVKYGDHSVTIARVILHSERSS